jgi:hypothetical protein
MVQRQVYQEKMLLVDLVDAEEFITKIEEVLAKSHT